MDKLVKMAELFAEAVEKNRNEYMKEYMANRYHQKRQNVIDQLGGKCKNCGSTEGPLHLDHIDSSKKTMRAADIHSTNDKKVKQEIKNLQLLCEKCHKEKTKEDWDFGVPKSKHGTYWMFRKYKCRCPKCVAAYKEYIKKD